MKSHGRRPRGSLVSAQKAIWAVIQYNWDVIDDETVSHEIRQRACNSLTQAVLCYAKVTELYDLAQEMAELKRLANGNGHAG